MTPDFASAQRAFAEFVEATPLDARVLVFHDSDADGVTAGVVLQRALERRGFTNVARSAPTRERDARGRPRIGNSLPPAVPKRSSSSISAPAMSRWSETLAAASSIITTPMAFRRTRC